MQQDFYDLASLARALGGEVSNGQVLCPGPGHKSAADRSLSVKPSPDAPDGFLVHSFAGDDPILCRDYVRQRCGLPAFKPTGGNGRARY
jgi:putative DNA primase/helicase